MTRQSVSCQSWGQLLRSSTTPAEFAAILRNEAAFGRPGIYTFAETGAEKAMPRCIGLASRTLDQRLKQHFASQWLQQWPGRARHGSRSLLVAEMLENPAYSVRRMIGTVARALILKAHELGYELRNRHHRSMRAFRPFDDSRAGKLTPSCVRQFNDETNIIALTGRARQVA